MSQTESKVMAFHLTKVGADRLKEMVSNSRMGRLIGITPSFEDFENQAVKLVPDILAVEFDSANRRQAEQLERLRRICPYSAVLTISRSNKPNDILAAMRLGSREFILLPKGDDDELVEKLANQFDQAAVRLVKASDTGAQGKLITVMGAKGGVGASSIALNLAWAFGHDAGTRVSIADLDLAAGDAAFLLDLEPKGSIVDAARNFDRLDPSLTDSLLTEAAPGLGLMAAPPDPISAEEVSEEHVSTVLGHLLTTHPIVVADLPSRLDGSSLAALEKSSVSIIVTEATLPAIKATRRLLALCERLGRDPELIKVVVNRADSNGALSKKEVEKALGRQAMAWLPNDYRLLSESGNAGRPAVVFKPRAGWSKAMSRLVKLITKTYLEDSDFNNVLGGTNVETANKKSAA